MEVSGAAHRSDDEEQADARVQSSAKDSEQHRLAESAREGESISDEVELAELRSRRLSARREARQCQQLAQYPCIGR